MLHFFGVGMIRERTVHTHMEVRETTSPPTPHEKPSAPKQSQCFCSAPSMERDQNYREIKINESYQYDLRNHCGDL